MSQVLRQEYNMKSSQKGFALIQVLFALIALGGVTYFLLMKGDLANKTQNKASFDQIVEGHNTKIKTELSDYLNCTVSFRELSFGTQEQPNYISSQEGIYKGVNNLLDVNLPNRQELLTKIMQKNLDGVFIKSMSLLSRHD